MNTFKPIRGLGAAERSEPFTNDPMTELNAFADIAFLRRRLKRGEVVFHSGDRFESIYAVRSGFFKSVNVDDEGREQVMGFFMRGELFGLDGIGMAGYDCSASALEDSEIIVLPFALMQEMARDNRLMQHQMHALLSREIARGHGVMMLLGTMRA